MANPYSRDQKKIFLIKKLCVYCMAVIQISRHMVVRASAQNVDLVQPYLRYESERSEYLQTQRIDCSRQVLFYTVISDN